MNKLFNRKPLTKLNERYVDGVDNEGEMANSQLKAISDYATKISELLQDDDQLPAWIQAKLAVIQHDIDEVFHFLDGKALKLRGIEASTVSQTSDVQDQAEPAEDIMLFSDDEESDESEESDEFMTFDEFDKEGAPEEESEEDLVDLGDDEEDEDEEDEEKE